MSITLKEYAAQDFFRRVDEAKVACYYRLHPQPWIETTQGARILYDAVCDLWCVVARERTAGGQRRSAVQVACETSDGLLNIHPETETCNVCGAPTGEAI